MGSYPNFASFEFLAADVFNAANGVIAGSVALSLKSAIKPGLYSLESMSIGVAGLVTTTSLPSPFAVVFGTGVVALAHGTVTNADTHVYTNNFASLVPASGAAVVGYLVASYVQIGQSPRQVVGPPAGHPDYNPAFISYTMYTQAVDSIAVTATLTAPDNVVTFELARFILTPGLGTLPAANSSIANRISGPNTTQILGGTAGVFNPVSLAWAGTDVILSGASTLTLPPASASTGLIYHFINRSNPAALVTINSPDGILGWSNLVGTAVSTFALPNGAEVELMASRGIWQVRSGSLLGINGLTAAGVTATSGLFATSGTGTVIIGIAPDGVTNGRLANMTNATIKGNMSGGTANPVDLGIANTSTISWQTTASSIALNIIANSVSNTLLADMGAFTIKANPTGATASPQDITLQQTGTILITLGGGQINWSIVADSVSNALLANMPALRIKGNATGGAANPQDLTIGQLQGMMGIRSFSTGNLGISPGQQYSFAHNVGLLPSVTNVFLTCVSNDQGYAVGNVISVGTFTMVDQAGAQNALNSGVVISYNAANTVVSVQLGRAPDVFAAPSRSNGPGNTAGLDNSKWVMNIILYWLGV